MSQAIKRFFYVMSERCETVHIQYGKSHSEGLTACGRMTAPKLWRWMTPRPRGMRVCKVCESAN